MASRKQNQARGAQAQSRAATSAAAPAVPTSAAAAVPQHAHDANAPAPDAHSGDVPQQPALNAAAVQALLNNKIASLEGRQAEEVKADFESKQVADMLALRRKQLNATLAKLTTDDEKLQELMRQLEAEMERSARATFRATQLKSACTAATAERDNALQAAHRSASLHADAEAMCRSLEARNKSLSDELYQVIAKSDETRRQHQDLKNQFESALSNINTQLEKHTQERIAVAQENDRLRATVEQMQQLAAVREEHFQHSLKTKDLENQLLEAKLKQQKEFAVNEARKAKEYKEKLDAGASTEDELKQQIAGYAEKFDQVQKTLHKSNGLFTTFKTEMAKMSTQLVKKEKERVAMETQKLALEKKDIETQLSLITYREKANQDKQQVDKISRQKEQLEHLCRVLEKERTSLKEETARLKKKLQRFEPEGRLGAGNEADEAAGLTNDAQLSDRPDGSASEALHTPAAAPRSDSAAEPVQ